MMEQMLLGEIDPDTGQISYANNKSPQPETIDLASVVDIDDDRDDDVEDVITSFEDGMYHT